MPQNFQISGRLINIRKKYTEKAIIYVENGKINKITPSDDVTNQFILPGFIDAHVHIESSMLVPAEFARLAVVHGTVATVSDPHEIGNVLGVKGVRYMIENGKSVPFKFYFGAPSCVPATPFETAGASIDAGEIEELLTMDDVKYLAEMMNWPGVLNRQPEVMEKIHLAQKYGKVVDGHAPGLKGDNALNYIAAGISTDHECYTREEALDKLKGGMKIAIREGSAAKNFEALIDLLADHEDKIMFCSDDKHPDNLVEGHINELVKRALKKGINLYQVLKAACINPVAHYGLEVGLLELNDPADFIVIDNPQDFNILKTYIDGELMSENGKTNLKSRSYEVINNFNISPIQLEDVKLKVGGKFMQVIEPVDGQLITGRQKYSVTSEDGYVYSNITDDILKIVVVNRYKKAKPAVAMVKNFGLKSGAIASSVAHDSHNIIAVGVSDQEIVAAVNLLIEMKGGVAAVGQNTEKVVGLPVAGLMSDNDGFKVASAYSAIDQFARELGSRLTSPFMMLSFMALLVIPSCKLSDMGLFDGEKFEFIKLFSEE